MSRKFSEDQTMHFVKLYRELEPLWKVSHPHYKKRSTRIACLEKIIEEMNLSDFCIRDVMIKIKSLRSTYCQEVNKISKSVTEEETEHIYQSGLKWFSDMDYVMKNCGNLRAKAALINLQFPENDLFYLQEGVVATPIKMEVFEQQNLNIEESFKPKENGIVKRLGWRKNSFFKTGSKNRHRQSSALSQRFNEDQTMRFVKLYREQEPLWNVSHPHYKKRSVRIACLEKIVEEMNLSDFCTRDAMIKIKNLRSTYCQELNKIHRILTEKKPGSVYQPTLKWFPDMDYVMSNCGNLKTKTLMEMDFPDLYLQEEVIESPTEIKICDPTKTVESAEPQEIDIIKEIKPHGGSKEQDHSKDGKSTECKVGVIVKENKLYSRGPRRRIPKNFTKTNTLNNQSHNLMSHKFSEAIRELTSLSRTLRTRHAIQNEKVEDECDIVGRHVALQLRELPPASRLQAQLEIQKVLCNCRLNILETNQTTDVPVIDN